MPDQAKEKKDPPLRFATMKDAKAHIKANKMKIKEKHNHTRGVRLQVLHDGKPKTIVVLSKQ